MKGRAPRESGFEGQQGLITGTHRNFTGLRETETPLLEGTHRISCLPGPGAKSSDLVRDLGQTYLLVLQGLLQRQGSGYGSLCGTLVVVALVILTGVSPLGGCHFLTKT